MFTSDQSLRNGQQVLTETADYFINIHPTTGSTLRPLSTAQEPNRKEAAS